MKYVSLIFPVMMAMDSFAVVNSLDLWEDSAANFNEILEAEHQNETDHTNEALEVIRRLIISRPPDQSVKQYEVFAELRDIFTESEFSNEELVTLIEDAMELKKKYLLIFDFVVRSEYARRLVKENINADEVLQFASSEYIQLPKFILREKVNGDQLNEVLSDLGCGVVWKDRAKYLFVLNKYFGKKENREDNQKHFPRRVRNYFKLLKEVDKFFGEAYMHLIYVMAQDFYYADVSPEKIKKIFSFSDKEWDSLIKPNTYE